MMIRKYAYNQTAFVEYLGDDPMEIYFDYDIPICDYKTMTPKEFYNNWVSKGRPCLFPGYAKTQKAYEKWNNITYMKEVAGDEIIWAER